MPSDLDRDFLSESIEWHDFDNLIGIEEPPPGSSAYILPSTASFAFDSPAFPPFPFEDHLFDPAFSNNSYSGSGSDSAARTPAPGELPGPQSSHAIPIPDLTSDIDLMTPSLDFDAIGNLANDHNQPWPSLEDTSASDNPHTTSMNMAQLGTSDFNWPMDNTTSDFTSVNAHLSSNSSHSTPPNDASTSNYLPLAPRDPPPSDRSSATPPKDSASEKARRRERNSIAARKYRQKRIDRIAELEEALARSEKERAGLRVEVERWKTKATVLEELTSASRSRS